MRIGSARAAQMFLLGEAMTAEQALSAGFVSALLSADELLASALAEASELPRKPPQALKIARALMRSDPESLHNRIDEEAKLFEQAFASTEAGEACTAFLEKRDPVFALYCRRST